MDLGGKEPAHEFLATISRSNIRGAESLKNRIEFVAEHDRYENQYTFRSVGEGVYEFKAAGLRLYAFYDDLPGLEPQLIIATNGGTKNTPKEQRADIAKAAAIRVRYLRTKKVTGVKIQLITLDHED